MDALNEVDNLIQQNMALAKYPGNYLNSKYRKLSLTFQIRNLLQHHLSRSSVARERLRLF
jgi:hypothetical protein